MESGSETIARPKAFGVGFHTSVSHCLPLRARPRAHDWRRHAGGRLHATRPASVGRRPGPESPSLRPEGSVARSYPYPPWATRACAGAVQGAGPEDSGARRVGPSPGRYIQGRLLALRLPGRPRSHPSSPAPLSRGLWREADVGGGDVAATGRQPSFLSLAQTTGRLSALLVPFP